MTQLGSRRGSTGVKKSSSLLCTLDSGKKISTNDYVYFDQDRTDRAYQVGRCMGPVRQNIGRQISDAPPSIEVEIFYRHHDLHPIFFPQSDHRRLYGSLRSVIVPVVNIKDKCTVLHRHHILNFDEYIKIDNCFYFDQVYYQQQARFYNAVPTNRVKNIPARLLKTLHNQFHYLLCEPEVASSITQIENHAMKAIKEDSSSSSEEEMTTAFKGRGVKRKGRISSEKSNSSAEEDSESSEYEGLTKNICDRVQLICTHNYPYRYYNPQTDINPEDPQAVVPPPGVGVGPQFQVSIPAYLGPHPKKKINLESRNSKKKIEDSKDKHDSDSDYTIDEAVVNSNLTQNTEQSENNGNVAELETVNIKSNDTESLTVSHNDDNNDKTLKNFDPSTKSDSSSITNINPDAANGLESNYKQTDKTLVLQSHDTKHPLENGTELDTSNTETNETLKSEAEIKDSPTPKSEQLTDFNNRTSINNREKTHLNGLNGSKQEYFGHNKFADPPNSLILFHAPTASLQKKAERILSELKKYTFCIPTFWSEFQIRAMQEMTRLDYNFKAIYSSLQNLSPIDFGVVIWTSEEMDKFEDLLVQHGSDLHTIALEFPDRSRADVVRQFFRWKGTMHKLASEDRDVFKQKSDELKSLALENTAAGSGIPTAPAAPVTSNTRMRRRTIVKNKSTCVSCNKSGEMTWHHLPTQPYGEKEATYCEDCASYFYRYAIHYQPTALENHDVSSPKRVASTALSRSPSLKKRGRSRRNSLSRASSIPPTLFESGSLIKNTRDSLHTFAATSPPSTPLIGPQIDFAQTFKKPAEVDIIEETEVEPVKEELVKEFELKTQVFEISPNHEEDVQSPVKSATRIEKRIKRNRAGNKVVQATPEESATGPALIDKMCFVCHAYERNDFKVSCAKCKLVAHKDCYLIETPIGKSWYCDPCRNISEQSHSKDTTCMICHVSCTANLAVKPTVKFNWGHVICAVLQPSIRIHSCIEEGNEGNISGISDLNLETWNKPCQCCKQIGGFKAKCEKCDHLVHGSCALSSPAYQIGFNSDITPVVRCPAHPSTMSSLGAIDDSGQSLLVRHLFKRSLPTSSARHNLIPRLSLRCAACNTPHSPMWWRGTSPQVHPGEMPSILTPYLPSLDPPGTSPASAVWCHGCRWKGPNQSSPPSLPTPALS